MRAALMHYSYGYCLPPDRAFCPREPREPSSFVSLPVLFSCYLTRSRHGKSLEDIDIGSTMEAPNERVDEGLWFLLYS